MGDGPAKDPKDNNWSSLWWDNIWLFPYIEHENAPPECAWKVGPTHDRIAEDFLRAEAPFVPEVERIIREACSGGSPATDSLAVGYLLGLRGAAVMNFWAKFGVMKDGVNSTIIPGSLLPSLRVLEWFLIDWWRQHGPQYICECRVLDDIVPWEEEGEGFVRR